MSKICRAERVPLDSPLPERESSHSLRAHQSLEAFLRKREKMSDTGSVPTFVSSILLFVCLLFQKEKEKAKKSK